MNVKLSPWFDFFRIPNLPTAPGDAVAGAAICILTAAGAVAAHAPWLALTAGVASLFMYMFGLADNDIIGADEDKIHAPHRPLPSGSIAMTLAISARRVCLMIAIGIGVVCRFPLEWWCVGVLLFAAIVLYNRIKGRMPFAGLLLMGACRGLSLLSGAAAMAGVVPSRVLDINAGGAGEPASVLMAPGWNSLPVWAAALGWMMYTIAVTLIAAREHEAGNKLGLWRFLPGLSVFVPMLPLVRYPNSSWVVIGVCTLCAYGVWCLAVLPLGHPHGPAVRRKAVGNAIGALVYLQAAYVLSYMHIAFFAYIVTVFVSIALIRRFAPRVSGS